MGTIVDSLQCGCNPGKVYKTKTTFDKHKSSEKHKHYQLALENKELRVQLAHMENRNKSLQHTIMQLEALKAPRRVSESIKKRVAASQAWRCSFCQLPLPASYQIDHTIALRFGGSNDETNLQAMCPLCHAHKTQTEVLPEHEVQPRINF